MSAHKDPQLFKNGGQHSSTHSFSTTRLHHVCVVWPHGISWHKCPSLVMPCFALPCSHFLITAQVSAHEISECSLAASHQFQPARVDWQPASYLNYMLVFFSFCKRLFLKRRLKRGNLLRRLSCVNPFPSALLKIQQFNAGLSKFWDGCTNFRLI